MKYSTPEDYTGCHLEGAADDAFTIDNEQDNITNNKNPLNSLIRPLITHYKISMLSNIKFNHTVKFYG